MADREVVTAVRLNLCWWNMAGYSFTCRMPFARLAPSKVPAILISEGAARSLGAIPLRPLASFLCETAKRHGHDLLFEDVLQQLRQLLPDAPDDEPAAAPGGPADA